MSFTRRGARSYRFQGKSCTAASTTRCVALREKDQASGLTRTTTLISWRGGELADRCGTDDRRGVGRAARPGRRGVPGSVLQRLDDLAAARGRTAADVRRGRRGAHQRDAAEAWEVPVPGRAA